MRRIERGFAPISNRFLHAGFFVSLGQLERSLYFFLVLAGDRNGVSFYAYDKICSTLAVTPDDYVVARNALIDKDLVAFDGTRFQVLSLPPRPLMRPRPALTTPDDFESEDPATIRQLIRKSLDER
ncbi:MAG: hypothetical protein GY944_11570 [bacterium]|nr:hypothetical protein [bacterium]